MDAPPPVLEDLARSVLELDREGAVRAAGEALLAGVPPETAITAGLAEGMRRVGERFAAKVYFVPEVLVAGRIFYAAMEVLAPHVARQPDAAGTMVCAVVEGDFHDIGKNIVKLMVEAAGFRVVDLGKNVPAERILEAVERERADLVGLSTLMTPTLDRMARTVKILKERTSAAVLVGGAPVDRAFAAKIGADGTAPDAAGAVALAREFAGRRRR
ncbi:MAG: corrinoid protein [Planctomycetes bacterium]|jgi:methanogenic corrinoid protein MtbC1|nr:corrinoid protein [Planctomycetota bacterium]